MKKTPDIGVVYPNYFSKDFEEILTSDIQHDKLNLEFIRQEPEPYAAIEWIIPGIIATYLFKSYFEAFLKEAGKDHYQLLKSSLGKLLRITKDIPVNTVVAKESTLKVDKNNSQSKAVSIHVELKNGMRIKLLFDNNLEADDWVIYLNKILDLLHEHYEKFPSDNLSDRLKGFDVQYGSEIYAIIEKSSKEWKFFDWNLIKEM